MGPSSVNVNFFQWLRDSVRQSVILGVSDAVEQIGVPEHEPETPANLSALLGYDNKSSTKTKRKSTSSTNSRKRLGKSLKDMDNATTKK